MPSGRTERDLAPGRTLVVRDHALPTLDPIEAARIDAWWRAANYLSVGQIYLRANPLLRTPLLLQHVNSECREELGAMILRNDQQEQQHLLRLVLGNGVAAERDVR